MEKLIYDSSNGLWYELQGDYYIPCLSVPETQPIGKWGRMHLRYLQEHRTGVSYVYTHCCDSSYISDTNSKIRGSSTIEE